ncbi:MULTISPECIES: lysophospholipid acyltransferase family protein [Gordonia]|uniref:Phospholipid/glycerol acyltransferase domain-containing protein n=2 Tax=Gordonia TaxID=2053 RepID=L7LE25_9ACTN|nr:MULTISPECIES: lysophospholipid acyltransferase family protein [Gordonia]AUH67067.1 glycerol acyltransferase [Gordonia sp. YC-JH1]KJR09954.1 glycerol acyltransferase [Gordonia sihwensis]KXT58572.1 glycerol acyltransferase [Gordonia sp. QH-12]MBY4569186.1 glycerol acyltransferase [Gordonia sihwensis]WFN93293.1 lysophospholipid acyltransferase family protein [Gordonia sihwensis]
MAAAERPGDSRTAKVIALYTDPNAQRRSAGTGHPNTDGFGRPAAGVTPIHEGIELHDEPSAPVEPVRHSPLFSLGGLRGAIADSLIATSGFIRERLTGDYEVDEFGFDPHFTESVFFPAVRQVYEKWFRVEVTGVENLPTAGAGLLVANHAGSIPIDAVITSLAVRDNHPEGRYLRLLAADMAFETPVVGDLARRVGATLACNDDADALLRRGELTAVWPEGYKGIGKLYKDRYKLQRFGRGGFVTTALRTGAPIIPVSIVGSEEIYPMIADLKPLARALGLPYFPITPLFPWLGPLGVIPLPSKWHIHFGKPIRTDGYDESAADDPMTVFDLTDHVREEIQQTLFRMLSRRGSVYLG